jgi:uncharacterized membrane protein (UPF0127 family)
LILHFQKLDLYFNPNLDQILCKSTIISAPAATAGLNRVRWAGTMARDTTGEGTMRFDAVRGLVLALLLAWNGAALAAEDGPVSFGRSRLSLVASDGQSYPIVVEVARTPEQLSHGLMFRRALPNGSGMLFDFGAPRPVQMWMKNTLIPLDMLFIDAHGRVVSIDEDAAPGTLTPRGPASPVLAVLELPAGTARRLQIHPGDRVINEMFGK